MKKLIALISAIAVICTMSLTSFAEITVASNTEVTGTSLAPGATSGYDASYTSDKVNTQTTIVAVKGTAITTNSIQYINQLEQDSEAVINFDLKDTLAAGETVTVYMGGDAIDKTKIGTITCAADAPTKYTVTFKNGDTVLTTAQYDEGATNVTYSGETPTKDADNENTYTFAGWLDSETQTDVDLATLTVTKDITLIAKFDATPIQSGGEEILWGDVDGSKEVDAIDASWILTKAANSETVLENPDAADVDGSKEVDAIDAAWVLTKAANSETVFPVEE